MDIYTLIIILAVVNLFLGVFITAIKQKHYKAIEYWIAINFLVATGLILILLRGKISDFFSIVVGNTMLLSTLILRFIGYKKLIDSKISNIQKIILATLFTAVVSIYTIFSMWQDNMLIRMLSYNFYMFIIGLSIGVFLLKSDKNNLEKIFTLIAITFFIFSATYLSKNIGLFLSPDYNHFLQSNFYNAFPLILQITLDIVWTVSLLFIYAEIAMQNQKQSEERYKTLSDLTYEGIMIHRDGVIVDINLAFCRMLDYLPHELIGKNIINKAVFIDDIPKVKKMLNSKSTEVYEARGIKRDGTQFFVELEAKYCNYNDEQLRVVAVRDISNRKKQEAKLKDALETKEILLKEVHHRVKNNLQTIVSLLNQQKNLSNDPKIAEALRDSMSRVMSMALVHQFIYRANDLENVNMKKYINELINKLSDTYKGQKRGIQINTEIDEIFFDIDRTIPVALTINEILSNAFKYAFPENETGTIQLVFTKPENGKFRLCISDNGMGFPVDFEPEQSKTLGMYLIKNFAKRQLKGTLEITSKPDNGVKYEIEF